MATIELTAERLNDIISGAITAALTANNSTATPSNGSNIKKPDRPSVDLDINDNQWSFFLDEWKLYKRRSNLQESDIVDELRSSCTTELRKALFDYLGPGISSLSEKDLLDSMKICAVKGKPESVHRHELHSMQQ